MCQLPSRLDSLTVVAGGAEWIFLVVVLRPKAISQSPSQTTSILHRELHLQVLRIALLLNTHTIILKTVTYSHARWWLQGEPPYSPPCNELTVC
ncbi:hypothetical protein Hanom_Chr03g00251351 [Helianthus anomalus]